MIKLPAGRRRGATAVEFALTLPLLLLLVIGLIEFARLHNLRHAADNAAYEAARHVIVPGASVAEAVAHGNDLLARSGVRTGSIQVTPSTIGEETAQVTVQVSVALAGNSWLPKGLTANRTITRETTLMTERVPVIQARAVPTPPPPPPKPKPPSTGKDKGKEKGKEKGKDKDKGGNKGSGGKGGGSKGGGGGSKGGGGGGGGGGFAA